MTKEQEAEQAWNELIASKAGYINPMMSAREVLQDFKFALKRDIEKRIRELEKERQNTDDVDQDARLDEAIFENKRFLSLLETVKP